MSVTHDSSADFVFAISLIAALEGACVPAGAADVLPYLGMARAELTDYGQRLPAELLDSPVPSISDGIATLRQVVTRMLDTSDDLTKSLRLIAARQILLEAADLTPPSG